MKMQEPKQMPISNESNGSGITKQYYTVDEAIAYLEPRIRAMFQ
jgi:hypothetical protein